MLSKISSFLAFAALACAWMPGQKNMTALDGNHLFESYKQSNGSERRWLPSTVPIRGVNLGSMFIMEPWMASTEWANVAKCGSAKSEFDCVLALGQNAANTNFQAHWGSWITEADIDEMSNYGLNTIRIPVGYWIFESLKYSSEHFPDGALPYLENICGWAADKGFYIIIDLHGAPFAQTAGNADTGQIAGTITNAQPGFYQQSQYARALSFLNQMTRLIHGNTAYRNVGMLEILNEPETDIPADLLVSLRQNYYPAAFSTIRAAESALGISKNNYLHIQMMNEKWGAGDPTQYLTDTYYAAYDDHRYLKYDSSVTQTQAGYLSASCSDDRGGNTPTIVGEWSLSVATDVENSNSQFYPVASNLAFYQKWFGAQTHAYEKQEGWIFWSWKAQLGDPRWSYKDAVAAGIIPTNLNSVVNPCY